MDIGGGCKCDVGSGDGNSNKNPFKVTKTGFMTDSKRPLFYYIAFYRSVMTEIIQYKCLIQWFELSRGYCKM